MFDSQLPSLGNRTDGQYHGLLVQLSSHFEKTAEKPKRGRQRNVNQTLT